MNATLHPTHDVAAARVTTGLAYDRRLANRRAVFSLRHQLSPGADGHWRLQRLWQGITAETISEEHVLWHQRRGLVEVTSLLPSLGEILVASAVNREDATGTFDTSRTSSTAATRVDRRTEVPNPAFTLASAHLEIAAGWRRLLSGERLRRQFLVLKVQRHAAVDFQVTSKSAGHVDIGLTPVALPLRWMFGRTILRFRRNDVALESIEGLLDPRDRRRNGRWAEYLGRIEFETAVQLGEIADHPEGGSSAP